MRQWLFEKVTRMLYWIKPNLTIVRFQYGGGPERDLTKLPSMAEDAMSSEEYKEKVLRPMGYHLPVEDRSKWMGATRDDWEIKEK